MSMAAKSKPASARPVGRPKGTSTQRVCDGLREKILRLDVAPGTDIEEAALEQEYGVSRTPVREALIRLASEGLITLLPNRGARVAAIDISELPQLFEALEITQRLVLRWAAVRRTDDDAANLSGLADRFETAAGAGDFAAMGAANRDFHLAIGALCGNRYIAETYGDLLGATMRLARSAFGSALSTDADYRSYYDEVVQHHADMVTAIAAGDAEAADKLAVDHVALFRSRVTRHLESSLADEVVL
jgi:DNA-binding GntR family transcriptional regulator